jgi:hypothetical protein
MARGSPKTMALSVDRIVEAIEFLRRLFVMKVRIAELEAQLKAQTARADALQAGVDRLEAGDRAMH